MRRTIILTASLALGIFLSFGCSGGGGDGENEVVEQNKTEIGNEAGIPIPNNQNVAEGNSCFSAEECSEGLICLVNICQKSVVPVIVPPSTTDETPPIIEGQCPETGISNKNSGNISFSADKEAIFYCKLDDFLEDLCAPPFAYSKLADGHHSFGVYAIATNQKTSDTISCAWAVDTIKPEVISTFPADMAEIPADTKIFKVGFAEAVVQGGTVAIEGNGSAVAGTGALSDDGASYFFTSTGGKLADGDYVMSIKGFKDSAENVMDDHKISFRIDEQAPAVQIACPSSVPTNINSVSITFSANEPVQFFCKMDNAAEETCSTPFAKSGLADGQHQFSLFVMSQTQKKTGGGTCTWTVDTTKPVITSVTPPNNTTVPVSTNTFKISFSEPIAKAGTISIGTAGYIVPGTGTFSVDKTSYTFITNSGELADGSYAISINGFTDPAGNPMANFTSSFIAKLIPNPLLPNGAWAGTLASNAHPRLFGTKEYLKQLKDKKPALFEKIKASVANPNPNFVAKEPPWQWLNTNMLPVDAVVYNTTGESVYKEAIKKVALEFATDPKYNSVDPNTGVNPFNDHQNTFLRLWNLAIVYDQYHDIFSEAERQLIINYINKHYDVWKSDEMPFTASSEYKFMTYLLVAYATWGENPKAKDFRDYAINTMYEGKLLPVLLKVGDGGGGNGEGGWYDKQGSLRLIQALEMARLFEGYDGFEKAPNFFYSRLAYEMNDSYPGYLLMNFSLWERFPEEGDGGLFYGGYSFYPLMARTILAEYYRGTELAGQIANKNAYLTNDQLLLQDASLIWLFYLYANSGSEKPINISQMPLAHLASGEGRIYARSSWENDASWLRFECGDYFVGHQHFEVGNFEIYRNGHLATESGSYGFGDGYASNHWLNWYTRTIAHNSMLVYMPNEELPGWSDKKPEGNDGGQHLKWNPESAKTLKEWEAKKVTNNYEAGKIVAYENRPGWMFAACDGTKAYDPLKMGKWIREIVFLRPHTFIIFDRVVSTKAEYPKTWLIHSVNAPAVDASSNTFTINKDTGYLYGQSLLPAKPSMQRLEGYSYGGKDYPLVAAVPSYYVVGKWRIEVKPTEQKAEDIFLHVLSTDKAPNAQLIKTNTPGTVGVKVDDTEVYFNGDVGGSVKIGGGTYPLEARVKKNKYE